MRQIAQDYHEGGAANFDIPPPPELKPIASELYADELQDVN